MKILGVGCHPDDLEIACYGTLAKYVRLGHEVAVCHIANGNLGHVEIAPDELRKVRWREADEAAKVIGAAHYAIDIGDLYVTAENDELVRRLAKVIREVQPDLIITHNEHDYMNDHMQAYYATLRASFGAIDVKLEALSCHRSQVQWMLEHDQIDFLDFTRTCSRVRGFQSGVAYAEGFRPNHNYMRMTTKRLLP